MPPERVYTFNKDINHNDGTLACSIARAEMIRYELACKKMESEIEEFQHILHAQGEVAIGRIGSLQYNKKDDTIQFEPYANQISACANMWLPTLRIGNKISLVSSDRLKSANRILKSPIKQNQGSIFKGISRLAASIAIVVGVCFLATLLPVNHNDEAMKASLAPEFSTSDSEDIDEIVKETLSIIPSDKYKTYSEIDLSSIPSESTSPVVQEPIVNDGPTHYIIVAAVRNSEEADKYISQHSEDILKAMPYKNLYVVYNSTSSDKDDAFRLCREAAKKYPGAWICTK